MAEKLPSELTIGRVAAKAATPDVRVREIDYAPAVAAGRALGASMAGLGGAVAGLGAQIESDQRDDEKFHTHRRYLEFSDNWERYADEQMTNAQAGESVSDRLRGEYQTRAKEFFGTVPQRLRSQYDVNLYKTEDKIVSKARALEGKRGEDLAHQHIGDRYNSLKGNLGKASNKDEVYSALDEVNREAETLISTSPLTPLQKDAARRKYRIDAADEAYRRLSILDPEEAKRAGGIGVRGRVSYELPAPAGAPSVAVRTNNPGNQWMGPSARLFGASKSENVSSTDQPAVFPDKVTGAAAMLHLLNSGGYRGKTVEEAIYRWANGRNPNYPEFVEKQSGVSRDTVITPEFLQSPQGIAAVKAMARWEAGHQKGEYPLSDDGWKKAQQIAFDEKERAAYLGGVRQSDAGGPVRVASLAPIVMANQSAIRDKDVNPQLRERIGESVAAVYGDGYKVEIYSGGQDPFGTGYKRTGSTRHDDGGAADFRVIGPDGKRVTGDALAPLIQYYAAKGYGGIGATMGADGSGLHFDLRGGDWDYANQGGVYTPAMADAVRRGRAGEMPRIADAHIGDPRFSGIAYDRRSAIYKDAETNLRTMANEAEKAKQIDEAVRINDLKIGIMDGRLGTADVQAARQTGWLRDAGDISAVNTMIERREAGVANLNRFMQGLDSGYKFNPYVKEDKAAVDAGFTSLGGDAGALQRVFDRTGMVPAPAGVALRGALVSNDPVRVANAATVAANILNANPNGFVGVDGRNDIENAAVGFLHDVERFGFSKEEAAKRLIEEQTPEFQSRLKARLKGEDIKEIIKKQVSINDLRSSFDPSWGWMRNPAVGFDPKSRESLYLDYVNLFESMWNRHGDIGKAKEQAAAQLKNVWGVSDINGKGGMTGGGVVMPFAPEKAPAYAGIPNVSERIAADALKTIKGATGQDVDRKGLRIEPIPGVTSRAHVEGRPVPYQVWFEDKNGNVQMLQPGTGKAWAADPVAMRAAVERESKAAFDAARDTVKSDPIARSREDAHRRVIEAGEGIDGARERASADRQRAIQRREEMLY